MTTPPRLSGSVQSTMPRMAASGPRSRLSPITFRPYADLIDNGNPTPLTVGDDIWIQPGTESTLYTDLQVDIGKIGLLPIVRDNFDTHAETPLLAFVAFQLEDCGGHGNSAYVQGHFVRSYTDYDGTPGPPDGT